MGPTNTTASDPRSSASISTPNNLFELDTKGICLLCLRKSKGSLVDNSKIPPFTSTAYSSEDERNRAFQAFKVLLRYLNIDVLQQCCNFLPDFLQSVDGFQREGGLVVKLCSGCLKVCQEFSNVFKEFERIRLQLDRCVQTVYQRIQKGEASRERVQEYERTLKQGPGWNPLQLFHVNIADNLRRETLRKCTMKVERLIPRVTISKPYHHNGFDGLGGYSYGIDGPICVITATQGDLTNEEHFQGPTSMLKVEAASEGGMSPIQEDILSLIKDDDDPIDDDGRDSTYHPRVNGHHHWTTKGHPQASSASTTGSNSLTCKWCHKKFFSKSNAHVHRITVHTFDYYSHELPPGATESQLRLAINYWLNQLNRLPSLGNYPTARYACSNCSRSFRDRFSVKLHCLENHFARIVDILKNPLEMDAANVKVLDPRPYSRKVAVKRTGGKKVAVKRMGGRKGRQKVGSAPGPIHRCPLCKKEFAVLTCMKRHYKMFHTKAGINKGLVCHLCCKKFTTPHNHRTHMNSVHVFEEHESRLPPGTTKEQLLATLKNIASEQARDFDPRRNKMGIRCNFCKKLCLDTFFFKFHAVENHFEDIVARLSEEPAVVEGQNGHSEDSSNQWQQQEEEEEPFDGVIEHVTEDEEEIPIDNFMTGHMLELHDDQRKDTLQENHSLNGDNDSLEDQLIQPEAVPIVMQVEAEDDVPYHHPPPKFRNKFRNKYHKTAAVKGGLEHLGPREDEDDDMAGISDVPPILDRYNAPD